MFRIMKKVVCEVIINIFLKFVLSKIHKSNLSRFWQVSATICLDFGN